MHASDESASTISATLGVSRATAGDRGEGLGDGGKVQRSVFAELLSALGAGLPPAARARSCRSSSCLRDGDDHLLCASRCCAAVVVAALQS
jgi:hypothetical protein